MLKKILQSLVLVFLFVCLSSLGSFEPFKSLNILFIAAITVLATFFQPSYNPFEKIKTNYDKNTLFLLIWSVYISQFSTLIYSFHFNTDGYFKITSITYFFYALSLLGVFLRAWSYYTLGKFFTADIQIQEDQKIITSGPYKYLAHPSYTGALLIYTSFPLILRAWWLALFSFLLLLVPLILRIKFEEKALIKNLGPDYLNFLNSRKRIIPLMW